MNKIQSVLSLALPSTRAIETKMITMFASDSQIKQPADNDDDNKSYVNAHMPRTHLSAKPSQQFPQGPFLPDFGVQGQNLLTPPKLLCKQKLTLGCP